jgi:WD40 repeat protein
MHRGVIRAALGSAVVLCCIVVGCSSERSADGAGERVEAPARDVAEGVASADWVDAAAVAVSHHREDRRGSGADELVAVAQALPRLQVAFDLGGVVASAAALDGRRGLVSLADGRVALVDTLSGRAQDVGDFGDQVVVASDQTRDRDNDGFVLADGVLWRIPVAGPPTRQELHRWPGATAVTATSGRGRQLGGNYVVLGGADGTVRVLDADNGAVVADLPSNGSAVTSVTVSPWTADVMARHEDGSVQQWKHDLAGSWTPLLAHAEPPGAGGVEFRPDGSAAVLWGAGGSAVVSQDLATIEWANSDPSRVATYSPDSFRLVTVDSDGRVVARTGDGEVAEVMSRGDAVAALFVGADRVVQFNTDGTAFVFTYSSGPASRAEASPDAIARWLCALPAVRGSRHLTRGACTI